MNEGGKGVKQSSGYEKLEKAGMRVGQSQLH